MINKKQYIRLTIVLIIPFVTMSWWITQQDSFLERGKFVWCDVQGDYCEKAAFFPVRMYADLKKDQFNYNMYDGESIIFLRNFNYEIGPSHFLNLDTQEKIIDPDFDFSMTSSRLEQQRCSIANYYYSCENSHGQFMFKDPDNVLKFDSLIKSAKNELSIRERLRLFFAIGVFLAIFSSYLVVCGLIYFIIHGYRFKE